LIGNPRFLAKEPNQSKKIYLNQGLAATIVVMFPCIYATSFWLGTGTVYNPPIRNWGFDNNFTSLNKLPALTPIVVNYVTP